MQIKRCQSIVTIVLFSFLGLFLTGCESDSPEITVTLVPVNGKVTRGGEPVSALLHFMSTKVVPRRVGAEDRGPKIIHPGCPSTKDGDFSVVYANNDGAPVGEYDVLIYTLPERISLEAYQSASDPMLKNAIQSELGLLQQGRLPPDVKPAVVKRITIPAEGLVDVVWELDGLPIVPPPK